MKNTELRIGNLILVNEIAKPITLTMMYEGGLDEYCKYIPLTEDLLLSFGFKKYKDNYGSYYIKQSRTVKIRKNGIDRYGYEHSRLDIKYVHQLQNLYFAITETELTLKPLT